jgi:hypothetical protein
MKVFRHSERVSIPKAFKKKALVSGPHTVRLPKQFARDVNRGVDFVMDEPLGGPPRERLVALPVQRLWPARHHGGP